ASWSCPKRKRRFHPWKSPTDSRASTGTRSCGITALASRVVASRRTRHESRAPCLVVVRLSSLEPGSKPDHLQSEGARGKHRQTQAGHLQGGPSDRRNRTADHQVPQRALLGGPPIPTRRAVCRKEPIHVSLAGGVPT